jgi:hypothetical protein
MRRSALFIALMVTFASTTFALSKKMETLDTEEQYRTFTVLDKGVKRTILIPKESRFEGKMSPYSAKQIDAQEGIVIQFTDPETVDIEAFEEKYQLKLISKMVIGYYIFKNQSKLSDIALIEKILKEEAGIKTLKPNWKKRNRPM